MFVHDGEKIKLRKVSFELPLEPRQAIGLSGDDELAGQGEHPCRAEKIPRLLGDLTHLAFPQLFGEE